QGLSLGNLGAGDSATKLETLIDKWFLGADHPIAKDPYNSTTYGYQEAQGSLFVNGPALTDIAQGYLGDCYLLASFGAVARINPGAISSMFTDNGDGTFTVRFFNNGAADYVTVDRMLPASGGQFIFANMGRSMSDPNNELWVALAEKAYAQLNEEAWIGHGSANAYQALSGGWMEPVLEEVTNQAASSYLNPAMSAVINALSSGKAVTAGTKGSTSNGIISGHAYVLTGYDATTGTFTFYNPWGTNQPGALTW